MKDNMQFRWGKIEVALLVDEVSEFFLFNIRDVRSSGVTYTVHMDPKLPNLQGDRSCLLHMLLELLSNAKKYTLECKRISLTVGACAEGICFAVKDNGLGISASDIPRVFEPFYQVDRPERYGCGVGLAVVREIVANHNGTIKVESELAVGSTFSVYLPHGPQD
jgi:signal transduction histidine kinase